jgi:hypothetical protein
MGFFLRIKKVKRKNNHLEVFVLPIWNKSREVFVLIIKSIDVKGRKNMRKETNDLKKMSLRDVGNRFIFLFICAGLFWS